QRLSCAGVPKRETELVCGDARIGTAGRQRHRVVTVSDHEEWQRALRRAGSRVWFRKGATGSCGHFIYSGVQSLRAFAPCVRRRLHPAPFHVLLQSSAPILALTERLDRDNVKLTRQQVLGSLLFVVVFLSVRAGYLLVR